MVESPSGRHGHSSFAPKQLYRMLTDDYDPYIESTVVAAVWYCKQKKGARHEFILIEVEDSKAGLINYIALERTLHDFKPTLNDQNIGSNSRLIRCMNSFHSPALDAFRISCNGDEHQLLRECHLLDYRYLERIDFIGSEHLFLYQLVTLVNIVSGMSPNYTVVGTNCYWFAGTIWECIRMLRPKARYKGPGVAIRGRFAQLRYTPSEKEIERICKKYSSKIEKVNGKLTGLKKNWTTDLFLDPESIQ